VALLALAACERPRLPFERSPSNVAVGAAIQRLLAGQAGCGGFEIAAVKSWQYPLENLGRYALQVDADVTAVRRAPPAAGDIAGCFGRYAETPADWPVGASRVIREQAWLDFKTDRWTLFIGDQPANVTLPPAPLHAYRMGINESPARE
jgi:hypothetical protein